MALSWSLQLRDQMSSVGRRAAAGLDSVTASMRRMVASSPRMTAALDRTGRITDALRARMGKLYGQFKGALPATGGIKALKSAFESVKPSLGYLMTGLGVLGGAAGAAALAGIYLAGKALQFKSDTLFAFKFIAGSAEGATALMARADGLARSLGDKTSSVAGQFRELRAGGFDQGTTEAIVAALADVRAKNPEADTASISKQMTQMLGNRKVTMEDLKPILDAGVEDEKFYTALQKITGITDQAKLKDAISKGKVSAEAGTAAILESVRMSNIEGGVGSSLGAAARNKAQTTVSGALENLHAQVERLFMGIDASPLGSSVMRISETLRRALDPTEAGGGRLLSFFNAVTGTAADLLDAAFTGDTLPSFVDGLAKAGTFVMDLIRPLGGGFLDGLKQGFGVIASIASALPTGSATTFSEALGTIGRVAGWVVTAIVALIAISLAMGSGIVGVVYGLVYGVTTFLGWMWNAARDIISYFGELYTQFADVGGKAVQGFMDGFKNKWESAKSLVRSLFSDAPAVASSELEVRSPSRVMARIGANTTEGFVMGAMSGQGDVTDAFGSMFMPPDVSFNASASAGMDGRSFSLGNLHVEVHPPAGSAAASDPDKLADLVVDKIVSRLEGSSLEMGGTGP